MRWEGAQREGSRDVSNCGFAFSSPCFLNDSSFHENTSCGQHMAWQRALRNSSWHPMRHYFNWRILLYPYLWKRDEEANPDRRGSDVQPFQNLKWRNSGMDGGFTACRLWNRSDRMWQKERKGKFVATSCWHRPRLQQRRWLGTSSAEVKGQLKGERDTRQKRADAD